MKTTTILDTLADTTWDSVAGYRKAAEEAKSPALTQLLTERAAKREATLDALNDELARFGEDRVTSGSASGWLHRKFTEVSAMFDGSDEAAMERIEEGEDYLKGKFAEAAKSDDLDAQSRRVVEQGYAEISQGERLSDLLEAAYD